MGERAYMITPLLISQSFQQTTKGFIIKMNLILHQRLIVTYSPKYALYQKSIRDKQVERAQKMLDSGNTKKSRKNPNDPARFIGKMAFTKKGEAADIQHYLDENKISEEARYDGLYAVCTDLTFL